MVRTKKVRRRRTKAAMEAVIIHTEKNQPPKNLTDYCICLFGEKGVGKTSQVSEFPDSLIMMLEPRRRNLKIRQVNIQPMGMKQLNSENPTQTPWQLCQSYVEAILKDDSVKTVGIDTVDRLYEACLLHHCYHKGVGHPNDMNDYGSTWALIKDDFESTLNKLLYAEKGLVFISHSKQAEQEELDGLMQCVPACSPACWKYIKAVCDFAVYYGYAGNERAMTIRGNDRIWSACGSEDHFLTKGGEPITRFKAGKSHKTAYKSLNAAFTNKLSDDQII